jgi:hypothetical protein
MWNSITGKFMSNIFDNTIGGSARWSADLPAFDPTSNRTVKNGDKIGQRPVFSKVFRWKPSDSNAQPPACVLLAGTFTGWRAVPLMREAVTNTWQVTLHEIPGNRTHRYMLLVDGEPAQDKNCDGLAVPQGAQEQQFQLLTTRGPRIFLLFAQTK